MAVTTKKTFAATTNSTTTTFGPIGIELNNQDDLDVYITESGGIRVLQLKSSSASTTDSNHPQVNDTTGLYFPPVNAGVTLKNYTISNDNNNIIFNSALPSGAVVTAERRTRDGSGDYTAFSAGSTIRSTDINNAFDETRFTAQEARNKAFELENQVDHSDVTIAAAKSIIFEGATRDDHEITVTAADATSDKTITFPDTTGTVVTTGDSQTVSRTMIANDAINGTKIDDDSIDSEHYAADSIDQEHYAPNSIHNEAVHPNAEIEVSKLKDGAARQVLQTASDGSSVEWTNNVDVPGTLDVTGTTTLDSGANISGNTVLGGNLQVSGTTTAVGINASGAVNVTGNLAINTNKLNVVAASGDTTIAGTLGVTGATTLTGALDANGGASIDNIQIGVTGDNEIDTSSGNLTIDSAGGTVTVDDNLTVTGTLSGTLSGTASTATEITSTANNSTDETVYPTFVDGQTGSQGIETDSGLTYNPSTGVLTSTSFTGNVTGNVTGNTSGSSGSCTGNAATATDLAAAAKVTNSEQAAHTADDSTYFTTQASDARYFNISTGDTIKDGVTFPDNDTTIATTAAINDRIIDLVDDVGGFVPIATELAFPNANPDVNNGAGTLVSIKTLSTNYTSNGSGVISISNGTVGNSTVTINGAENSTTYSSGYGMIVETTTTLNTYNFHRLVPKATEVTTVAGNATEIGRLGTAAAVADMALLGTTDCVADMALLGTSDCVSDMNTLAVSDVISDMNTLAVSDVLDDLESCANNTSDIDTVAGAISNVNSVAGAISNVNTTAGSISNVNTTAGSISNVNTVAGAISNVNTTASNIGDVNNFADLYQIANSNPSTDGGGNSLAAGDLYFNTSANELKVYNGSAWQGGVTASGSFAAVTGNTFTGDNKYNDNVNIHIGTNSDTSIYHNDTDFYVDNDKGDIKIRANVAGDVGGNIRLMPHDDEDGIKIIHDGNVELYANNTKKLEVTSAGITVTGTVIADNLDIGTDVDVDGTLEADAITVNGTALNTVIAGVTVTNATNAAHVSVADNESTNEENKITFIEDASATGNVGLESDGDLTYNPSTGTVSATVFKGNVDAVDGDFDGTLEADAITDNGTALDEYIADTVGAMVSSNTETNITVTYQDSDNTLDFVIGTLNQNTSGTAAGLSGTPSITVNDVTAASLDISGDADIDGTMEADAYTVNGTALDEFIADTVGAMVSSNSESGISVTYQDSDNTLDFSVSSQTDNNFTTTLKNKLDAIEASATADQTDEEIQDIVGGMVTGNTESGITVTYQDSDGTIDFTVASQTDENYTTADHDKLDGIAASANNYSHPNHSGEVTSSGDGATTIASNVVDEDNLKISNSGSDGQVLTKQSGNTGGLTWATLSDTNTTYSAGTGMTLSGTTFSAKGDSCKVWCNWNGQNTPAIRDSFNVDSLTDHTTAEVSVNIDTDFANANYAVASHGRADQYGGARIVVGKGTPNSGGYQFQTRNTGNNSEEIQEVCVAMFGDQ